jgi:hypothetical protein
MSTPQAMQRRVQLVGCTRFEQRGIRTSRSAAAPAISCLSALRFGTPSAFIVRPPSFRIVAVQLGRLEGGSARNVH